MKYESRSRENQEIVIVQKFRNNIWCGFFLMNNKFGFLIMYLFNLLLFLITYKLNMYMYYSLFHKTLPKSCLEMNWTSVSIYEMGVIKRVMLWSLYFGITFIFL